ncbi:Cof-type HAD-IIB family hydrolase [Leptolyngbya sp. FACHB-261]|uniref:Cof-type HAD-IIB family hydrolase n=1 Tax=Leptolyngbya sp. FACHB-261 TaxID=2692806 RepID=UPI001685991E|nr:Cof-type HAD-IIB family hydrolase [Leptolyngbya sp. FACHB-261]MBD2101510.1 HAD family phosphatase [Leptolyngbya sp. FACHB-261]
MTLTSPEGYSLLPQLAVEEPPTSDIRLLVLDIDGTIAGVSNQIREPVKQAVQAAQAKGVLVAIATGRMYHSAVRFHRELNCDLPLMAYQGALIQDPVTNKIYRHWTVPMERTLALLDHFDASPFRAELSVHLYINDQLYIRELTPASALYAERSGVTPIIVGDLRRALTQDLKTEPTKVLALSDNVPLISELLSALQQRYTPAELYLTKSVATFFEAANPLVNKGTAVKALAEDVLGLRADQVMAIGDNFNDVEMLQYAGIGVAMGEAPLEVQAFADWVAPGVEEDGVAAAIESFVL